MFTDLHITQINAANDQIQDLQRRQLKIYEDLLEQLPDLSRETNTKTYIWDYVFNNQTHSLALDSGKLRIEPIFIHRYN